MNLSEINWELEAAGAWPVPIKIAAGAIVCILVTAGWVYYDTIDQLAELEKTEQQEQELKKTFEAKQRKAVNLDDYRDQLKQIGASLGDMIRQMPTKAEVANLLVDISQTGLASGLEFKLFKPGADIRKEFYSELPINIKVVGLYEELGLFVSGLAALPRIVTVHNVAITPKKDGKEMEMTAVVKTYNEGVDEQPVKSKNRRRR
jgi:type IV pilus assembly protein PilO